MKVVIPVAGLGSRLKPHTFTVPKPLMNVAGKPIIDYIVEDVKKLNPDEIVFVVGYKRESVKNYLQSKYSDLNISFVQQEVRDGDGSAIRLALEKYDDDDDLFIVFGDTMVDFDYTTILKNKKDVDALVLGMKVPNPTHYGIMNIRTNSKDIYEVEEKPKNPKSDLAIIGAYYFKSLLLVRNILEEFYINEETEKGEYKIVQVIRRFIAMKNTSIKSENVKGWFDCGRPEVLLEANKYYLERKAKKGMVKKGSSIIISPSYVSSTAVIENSVIGPYASIADGAVVKNSVVKNSILSDNASVDNVVLDKSLIGKDAVLHGRTSKINVGEKSEVTLN